MARAIPRLHEHLAEAMDSQGRPHPVLRPFARHLHQYLLVPSGRGGRQGGLRPMWAPAGCFTYDPPPGVVWVEGEER